ncbi:MAG TPA: DEAD/DEAH box helicase [Candidatus Levybacteria bacterium]|nr:DEAD/DEAH box helicase [Candidatus Levybacteria bacterium]
MTYTRDSRGRSPSRFQKSYSSQGRSRPQGQFGRFNAQRRRSPTFFNPSSIISQSTVSEAVVETYTSKNTFADFKLHPELNKNIVEKGYITPTPIQDQAIPVILEGKDVIGIANTGTGKTAAFLIPLLHKVILDSSFRVLIVAPTRELAVQIRDELREFVRSMPIYSTLCIGGSSTYRQKQDLRRKPNFVIGTPGRLKDFIQDRSLNLSLFSSVVLDEADHMVDIGFIHDIKFIVSFLPPIRQSLFFSATVDGKVKEVLQGFVKNPITISVKKQDATSSVKQEVVRIEKGANKIDKLHDLLIQKEFEKVLIFGRTKWGVQKLSDELIQRGFKVGAIHGNKNQNQRLRTLFDFKNNNIQVLLATDVASRGLDIDNVSHVINYDLPTSYEDYIHRIGRTGRADKKGIALTFLD